MKAIYVTRPSLPDFETYMNEIKDLWDSHYITNMGSKHKALEATLKDYLEVEGLTLYTNGHLALESGLEAFDLEGEVITTPFTFISTTHAIVRKGLKPVFCDIREDNFTIDVTKIEDLITDKTCAIAGVHVYGNICDIEAIDRLAKKYSLKVIYDGAHAFGVKYKGQSVARFGDLTMFSFHATKVFHTIEGGGCCYGDSSLSGRLDGDKNFGITGLEDVSYVGGNAKMNEFQAAMGLCNLQRLDEDIKKRKMLHDLYMEKLKDVSALRLPSIQDHVESNYAYMPIIFESKDQRDIVYDKLRSEEIYSRKYFYPLTKDAACYGDTFSHMETPVAERISNGVLTLPLYPELELEDVERICETLRAMF